MKKNLRGLISIWLTVVMVFTTAFAAAGSFYLYGETMPDESEVYMEISELGDEISAEEGDKIADKVSECEAADKEYAGWKLWYVNGSGFVYPQTDEDNKTVELDYAFAAEDFKEDKTLIIEPVYISLFAEGDIAAEGYEGFYDGEAHGISVTAPEDATVKYGLTEGEYTESESPTQTEVGILTVYYEVSKTGYKTETGSKDVIINMIPSSPKANPAKKYTVKFDTDGGSLVKSQNIGKNALVAEPEAPTKEGFIFDGWYTDKALTEAYDFEKKVINSFTLHAKWTEEEADEDIDTDIDTDTDADTDADADNSGSSCDGGDGCPSFKFKDLDLNAWYHLDTDYVIENGLMNGTGEKTFEPNLNLTRAMLVTILYRAEGEPETINRSIPFADIALDAYYTNAVIWAQQNSIVNGMTENTFAPDDNITRQQLATIIYRYAVLKGYNTEKAETTDLSAYTDADKIAEYAVDAMKYAVGNGIINGKTATTLNPEDNATRVEVAAMLHRFLELSK